MNIVFLLCMFVFMTNIYLGLHVLSLDKKSKIHRLFFLLCFSQALWAIIAGIIYATDDKELIIFLFKTTGFIWIPYFALVLHFCLILTNIIKIKSWYYLILYILALVLIYRNLVSLTIYNDFIKVGDRWIFVVASDSGWVYFHSLYIIFNLVSSLVLLLIWNIKSKSIKEKRQAIILFIALFLTFSINTVDGLFLPALTDYKTFGMAPVFTIIFMLGIWYSIVKYRLLAITPELVSKDIIANIEESIILLDNKLRIIFLNHKIEQLLDYTTDNIRSYELSKIILEHDAIQNEIKRMPDVNYKSLSSRVHFIKKDNSNILMDSKFKIIDDKFGDNLGILIIWKEVRELNQFKSKYKITNRLADIIQYMLQGKSNKEIASLLDVTARTIKGHISYIYHKLKVKNKMELYNLLKEYNLIPEQPAEKTLLLL